MTEEAPRTEFMTTLTIDVPKEGVSIELMLVGDTTHGSATLSLPEGVVLRPPPLQYDLPANVILKADKYGWAARLAPLENSFFGHPVDLKIETTDQPVVAVPNAPSRAELNLATMILQNLNALLVTCEKKFTEETLKFYPHAQEHIHAPHFWISREFIEEGSRWAFVIGCDDAPDFGYHLEFDGLKYLGMSAGD